MTGSAPSEAAALTSCLAAEFRRRMLDEYVPRIRRCTELLSEEQMWTAPGPSSNSVANLLMHLAGNVRQWILCGLGGQRDDRDRPFEFSGTRDQVDLPVSALLGRLEETVRQAVAVVEDLTPHDLMQETLFQQRYSETGLGAVVHVIEHFSGHAGQIYAFTKQVTGADLKFHDL